MVRIKYRYLLVKILYPDDAHTSIPPLKPLASHSPSPDIFDSVALARLIRRQVTELFGDYGIGVVGGNLVVKYLSQATSTAIIRCPRDHYRLVWAALSTVTELPKPKDDAGSPGKFCVFQVVRVSGTMKKVEEEAIRHAKKLILQARDGDANSGGTASDKFAGQHISGEAQNDLGFRNESGDSEPEMNDDSDG
ncbi:MAG: hypothetical protein Q9160_003041 [Pyrenula sp. 1 TL-2023]